MRAEVTMGEWVIEFRRGDFFQSPEAAEGGPRETAQRFPTREDVEAFMRANQWVLFAGGMAVPAEKPATTGDAVQTYRVRLARGPDGPAEWQTVTLARSPLVGHPWVPNGDGFCGAADPRVAVVAYCREQRWPVAEILAPGEQSAADLRAILDGRPRMPTDAEVRAHYAATSGGRWLVLVRFGGLSSGSFSRWQEVNLAPYARTSGFSVYAGDLGETALATRAERWIPLGADNAFCAWPTVTP